jgi:hypothetical protein
MLLISGRFGLILVLASLSLSIGRMASSTLAALPLEIVQAVALLAIYGLAMIIAALIVRALRGLKPMLSKIGEED